ncbi:MAG: c-type cytochrome [Verrucomicrobiales bacterium]|nr:c-type cytochrome [Verrucomicrobiales bacterium]
MRKLPLLVLSCALLISSGQAEHPASGQLQFTKWTPDFAVPDPVAISFDSQGRAYVTQTQRRKANDLDIRPNSDWIPNDLSFTSTEDKENFYREQFTPENSAANAERVKDLNGDGIHDIKDLTVLSERIHLISDEDGDGFADNIYLYAEQLDHLIGGVAGGVLFHEGDVYVSPVPEVVKFRDTNGDNQADTREVIASGFGVHLAYAGHDMHGLFMGPDGRLYWSIGDKGIRVRTADGLDYRFPSQGGLMRCELDGSNFEVFAHGLRNVQEVSFDQFGNFFGVDNDADFEGEKERLVYIEQYLDSGWRSNWQYLREDYNPWNDGLMHVPYHDAQARWFTPPLNNYENGPAGFKFNPGAALSADYANYFFLTSAPRGEQWAFQVRPKGDAFEMVNDHKIGEGIALVGLNFAPDGALYGVDWGGGYPLNESGAVWRIDVPEAQAHPDRERIKALLAADFTEKGVKELAGLLSSVDRRIRLKAQWELAGRGKVKVFTEVAGDEGAGQLARVHAIWGLGQLVRAEEADDSVLVDLFSDADPEVKAQVIRTVTDRYGRRLGLDRISGPVAEGHVLTEPLVALLSDAAQRVQLQALIGLGRIGDPVAAEAIIDFLASENHTLAMTYLRHAGVIALAGAAEIDVIAGLSSHVSPVVRTCAVIALRRRGHEAVARFLRDEDPVIAADAARAIHDDWMIPSALPSLAEALGDQAGNEPLSRRAINANLRMGDAAAAERVAAFVAAGEGGEVVMKAGLEALENWTDPPVLDLVVGRHRPIESRDPSIVATALQDHLDAMLLSGFASVRQRAMALATENDLAIANVTLAALFQNKDASEGVRSQALRSLSAQMAASVGEYIEEALSDESAVVRMAGLELLAGGDVEAALDRVGKVIVSGAVPEQQHAIRLLPKLGGRSAMEGLVSRLVNGSLTPALQLDVIEVSKDPAFAEIKTIIDPVQKLEAEWQAAMATDMEAPFRVAMSGGNPERGRSLFMNHAAAQCIRCHKVQDGKGSNVGPNLKEIGKKKDAAYLLESLISPQKVVAKGYGNISLTLKDGSSVAGQFRNEKDGFVTIRDAENVETKFQVSDIAERSPVVSTMPPMGFILKKNELRDMIAFLQSLKG